jgi:DtxR family Mn-dependent transcriptional regulator
MSARAAALSESRGDYLECIHHLVRERGVARVKEIAARMGVRAPSVTGALRGLAARGLVRHDPYQFVTLTPAGARAARDLARRHAALAGFLRQVLGTDAATAERNACHMEHAIEPEVLERLARFVGRVQRCATEGKMRRAECRTGTGGVRKRSRGSDAVTKGRG